MQQCEVRVTIFPLQFISSNAITIVHIVQKSCIRERRICIAWDDKQAWLLLDKVECIIAVSIA